GENVTVLDTPGVNDLSPRTEDARVTCDVMRDHPDATIVQVADARNLRRALLLTVQLASMRRPMILVLNMMDELENCGAEVDVEKLSQLLGIPVLTTVATQGRGIEAITQALPAAAIPRCKVPATTREIDYELTMEYLTIASEILAQTYHAAPPRQPTFGQRLGWWATQPLGGLLLLCGALYLTFWFVGLFGAGTCVDFLETVVFGRYLSPWAIHLFDLMLPFPHVHAMAASPYALSIPIDPAHSVTLLESTKQTLSTGYTMTAPLYGPLPHVLRFVHDFFVGEYGLITVALSYGFAIVFPIVTTFFLLFGVLEDSGYLPRLAAMVNRIFQGMGLNGKAVLPMVLGLGCDTMATMTTRILDTRKERVVTTLLLALAVPCSAQLGVLLAMTARISIGAAILFSCMLVGIAFLVGWLASKLHGGETSDFILELPPMRVPQIGNLMMKTFTRLEWYLKEVIPLFVIGTAVLFVLDKLQLLGKISSFMEPLVTRWLGLPVETASAFLIGFLRRDYGAVYLLDASTGPDATLNPHQVLVAMVTITLFMPCIATLFMISRELGKKTAAFITVFVFVFAFLVGGLVNRGALWLGM
ncbi:MAG TPA: ferrous iron transporter B, partial [Candidatus Krumholzibacteria bacterium]|nr:ferrous iron transporter B [Candidatus Krumholzibacteria bacterium]